MNKLKILQQLLSEIGRKVGKASAKRLTAAQRTARARKAGLARQGKTTKAMGGHQ
jgi:hypothetical protein